MQRHLQDLRNFRMERTFIAIDLKSFYASVECRERELDPLNTNLVVADSSRTEKTICLAVSPSLKAYGIPGRPRLFEVVEKVKQANALRREKAPGKEFTGKSCFADELAANPSLELDYIVAPPHMSKYMHYSTEIYKIYLRYVAPEDMHVYSCDEVFIDATEYLGIYKLSPHDLTRKIIQDILEGTGITATAGIGTNMYLCKIAMDIVAKHIPADKEGVRIAELNERSYREILWNHTPLTDFWRVGKGTAKRLARMGLYTMGDVARYSERYEDSLYKEFGVNAELLIDHAWGWEPCTIDYIKSYRPENSSLSSGQVLSRPYTFEEAGVVVREMADVLALDLTDKKLVTDQIVLTVNFDTESLKHPEIMAKYKGEIGSDWYGRPAPKHAHGTCHLPRQSASSRLITEGAVEIYERTVDPVLLIRRITIAALNVVPESEAKTPNAELEQYSLFVDYDKLSEENRREEEALKKEKAIQEATLSIKKKYGKNAILKGLNFEQGATTRERNGQIGGHKA